MAIERNPFIWEMIYLEELLKYLRIEEESKSRDPKDKITNSSKVYVAKASKFQKNFKVINNMKFKKFVNGWQKFPRNYFFCEKKKAIDKVMHIQEEEGGS